jgi:hypothetical protein
MRRTALAAVAAAVLLTGCGSLAAQQGQAASTGAATPAPPPSATRPALRPSTVTYVVTGSPADVTWGPAGSDHQGTVPMHVTRPLRNPIYYAITAQLQGSGQVACAILVNGKVISRAEASGSFNIASCEASKDPLTGQWSDTNAGA